MEVDQVEAAVSTDRVSQVFREVLYPLNPGVAFLLHGINAETGEDEYTSRFASIITEGRDSALLQLHLPCYPSDEQGSVDASAGAEPMEKFVLDLMAKVSKVAEETDRSGGTAMITYLYERHDVSVCIDILPISPDLGPAQIQVFDFMLSQFVWFDRSDRSHLREDPVNLGPDEPRSPNVFAKGFEKAGSYFRKGLKGAGKGTGSAIRFLGKAYTDTTLKFNGSRVPHEVNDEMVARVE